MNLNPEGIRALIDNAPTREVSKPRGSASYRQAQYEQLHSEGLFIRMIGDKHTSATIADYLNANLEILGLGNGPKFGEASLRSYLQSVGLVKQRAPRTPKTDG